MENLRAAIEKDLNDSLESEWKIDVELTSPDGEKQTKSKNDPAETLGGMVQYFSQRENPVTGEIEVVNQPVVSLRISSLDRVPEQGEKWYIKMPISPVAEADKVSFVFTPTRAFEHGTDIGFMRIYPQKIESEGVTPVS